MATESSREVPRSVLQAAEKARTERLQRLTKTLEAGLGDPIPTVDALMSELGEGASHPELWEQLHAAAARDNKESALAEAYKRCADGPRMKRLQPHAQAEMLMRAADYFQGMLGDGATAEIFLERVVAIMPDHPDAFGRLERRLEALLDPKRLLELYAKVIAAPPRPIAVLATQALNRVLQLSAKTPLPDEACTQLLALVPTNPRLLDALETHCRATKRFPLACALIERTLVDESAPEALLVQRRKRLLQLYLGEAASPELAMPHVELLLERDPTDASVFEVGEKLLSVRKIASRAAAAMREARRKRGY